METYIVITHTEVNQHLLYSLGVEQFSTTNLREAFKVFNKEVDQLGREYRDISTIDHYPSEYELIHAVRCEIVSVIDGCEAERVNISGPFFE